MFKKKKDIVEHNHTLLYHHLGLGDFIILSGGIKYLKRNNLLGPVFCICKHHNLSSVKQLYADVDDFEIIAVNEWRQADILASQWKGEKMLVGFHKMIDSFHFDIDFYRILGVDFKERWDSFTIKRNFDVEKRLLDQINLPEKFAFVHDDISRGFIIGDKYINPDLPVVKPYLTDSIFDWTPVLEKATEIHCICSSFKHLIDSLSNIKADLFYHYTYVNNGKPRDTSISSSKKNWKVV